jgi:hypothetical protein
MDRRRLLATGGLAALTFTDFMRALASPAEDSQASLAEPYPPPPAHLLATAFSQDYLERNLLPASDWHFFPTVQNRSAWQALPDELKTDLIEEADRANQGAWESMLATEELEFKRNGNRSNFQAVQFSRRKRLGDLVLGECVNASGKYLDQIANGIWLTCEESFWGLPAHLPAQKAGIGLADVAEPTVDLFGAEAAALLALTAHLLNTKLDSVSPLLIPRIRLEAKRRILDPNLERNDFSWLGYTSHGGRLNNWTPWINSNWLLTILLLEQDPERRVRALRKSCESLDLYLAAYPADGACEEGPGYWNDSAGAYFDACATLVSATGGSDPGILTLPMLRRMGRYIVDMHIYKNLYVNYADAHVNDAPSPTFLYRFGKGVGDQSMQELAAYSATGMGYASSGASLKQAVMAGGVFQFPRVLADVLSAAQLQKIPKKDALTRDSWYPSIGLMTARRKTDDGQGFFLALQAASNGRSHGHNDSGSFIVYHDGEPVFIDVGVGNYTATTFGPNRYSLWTMQSAFHNLPTVGGVMQHEGRPYQAKVLDYSTSDAKATIKVDLAKAYPAEAALKKWMRTATLDRESDSILFNENFETQKSVEMELSFMTTRLAIPGKAGSLILRSAVTGVRDVTLHFDPKQLRAVWETIAITDALLRHSWGKEIYRVRLQSLSPVDHGDWSIGVVA